MCLETGSSVKIDGREATVLATSGNRICAEDKSGIPIVRDVQFNLPTKEEKRPDAGATS